MIEINVSDVYAGVTEADTVFHGPLAVQQPIGDPLFANLKPAYNKHEHLSYASHVPTINVHGQNYSSPALQRANDYRIPLAGYEPNHSFRHIPHGKIEFIQPLVDFEIKVDEKAEYFGHSKDTFGNVQSYAPLGIGQTPTNVDLATNTPFGITPIPEEAICCAPFWYNAEYPWGFNNYSLF